MNNKVIGLIAGQSGDSLTDELHKRNYKVAIVCGKINEPGYDNADFKIVTDLRNKEEIRKFFEEKGVKYFVVGTGAVIALYLAQYLEKFNFVSSINPEKSLLMKNKVKTKQLFERIGVRTPRYLYHKDETYKVDEVIKDIQEKIGIPCVIKSNLDAIQPCCANNEKELHLFVENVKKTNTDLLVEEYINGGDLTYCLTYDGKNTVHVGIINYSKAKEYHLVGFKNSYVAKLTENNKRKVYRMSDLIMKKTGVQGVARIDFMVDSNFIYALEVNSVIVTGYNGSAYPFFLKQGINIASVSIDNAIRIFEIS